MRRWFIIAFTLHFCIGVACYSIGHLHANEIQAQFTKAEAAQSDAPKLANALAEADERGHGLVDGHTDGQELIHSAMSFEFGQTVAAPHFFSLHERHPPILAKPHRPPISRPFT